jgi:hypothetical protein
MKPVALGRIGLYLSGVNGVATNSVLSLKIIICALCRPGIIQQDPGHDTLGRLQKVDCCVIGRA